MRPMFMEFTDENVATLGTQYMLGSQLLVAPIFNDRGEGKFYLPSGTWTNLLTNKCYRVAVGQWFDEQFDYLSLPLLARENTILLIDPMAEHAKYDYLAAPELHVFQPTEGVHVQALVDAVGNAQGSIKVTITDGELKVIAPSLSGTPTVFVHIGNEIKKFSFAAATAGVKF